MAEMLFVYLLDLRANIMIAVDHKKYILRVSYFGIRINLDWNKIQDNRIL